MKQEIIIRKALLEDAEELTKLNIECWQDAYIGMMNDRLLNNLSDIITVNNYISSLSQNHNIYVVLLNDKIIGFVIYGLPRNSNVINQIEIYAIYVCKEFYGCGVGYQLLNFVEANIKQFDKNISIVICTLLANKKAHDFYIRQGFNKTDISKNFVINGESYPEVQFIKEII